LASITASISDRSARMRSSSGGFKMVS
jgi:hypothetical protein